jgi:sulfite exporter TauE/SafE
VGLLLLWRQPAPGALVPFTRVLSRLMAPVARSTGLSDALLLGILTAFLPCGLTLAMLLQAAAGADPVEGLSGMLVFGLGTLPALLVTGAAAARVSPRVRAWGDRVGAGALVVLGVVMLVRGSGTACSLLHG